jgi:hypothetical protein
MGGSCKDLRLLLELEAGDGDDVALFSKDEGDAKKDGAVMLVCWSGFVTVVFTADAAAAEGGIDTLPNAPLVDAGIDTLPNAPLVDVGIAVEPVEAVLLEAVLLEAVLLEAVLLEAVLLEVVGVAVFSRWRFGVCASTETVARIPVFPVVAGE